MENVSVNKVMGVVKVFLSFYLFTLLPLSVHAGEPANYEVVPLPQSIVEQKGAPFILEEGVEILTSAELQREAEFLKQYIEEVTWNNLPIAQKREKKVRYIELSVSPTVKEKEGYVMTVSQKGVTIQGGSAAGVFYGIQTLRKAVKEGVIMNPVIITDAPRFSYRGMHLDCSRHFFSADFVKKYIDLLALHNMNRFHWHLTDDQGWRIEIKRFPELTTIGAQRSGTILGTNSDLDDGIPHGGFYTQEEAREIVKYAQERHITIIPEIDMPGHMLAALACYPELGCTGGPYQDETPTVKWENCAKCQALGLAKNQLQAYFTQKVFNFLTAHHRRALGWDEILDGCPKDAMIMSWRGTAPGAKAAQLGHDVVMAPTSHVYFDYLQSQERLFEPSRCEGFIPVEKVYSLDPAPDTLSVEARKHILGTQANIWTEYLFTEGMVEYQALPRMSALSEVQWTLPERKNYEAFKERLTRLTALYELYHYQYAKHLWPERQLPSRWQF